MTAAKSDAFPHYGPTALAALMMSLIERGFSQRRAFALTDAMVHGDCDFADSIARAKNERLITREAKALGVTKEKLLELGAQVYRCAYVDKVN